MSGDNPFHNPQKRASIVPRDFTRYGKWTPNKIVLLILCISTPYISAAILLFIYGFRLVAIILVVIIIFVLLSSWLLRKTLLRK